MTELYPGGKPLGYLLIRVWGLGTMGCRLGAKACGRRTVVCSPHPWGEGVWGSKGRGGDSDHCPQSPFELIPYSPTIPSPT